MHILFIVVFDQIFYILDYSYLHVACAFFSLTSLAREYSEHHTYELSGKSGIPSCRHVTSGFFYYVIIIVLRLPTLLLLLLLFRYAYILSLSCNVISTRLCEGKIQLFKIPTIFKIHSYISNCNFRYWFSIYVIMLVFANGILVFLTLRPSFSKTAWTCCTSIAAPTCFISRFKASNCVLFNKFCILKYVII